MKHIFLVTLILMSSFANSGQATETGNITWLLIHNGATQTSDQDMRVLIRLDGAMSGGFCTEKNWVITLNSEAANAQYSLLLAAYISDKSVRITGHSSQFCNGSQELVRNVEFP